MKIKYYLRGLGTGILFATLILTISYAMRNNKNEIETQTQTTASSTQESANDTTNSTSETTTDVSDSTGSINSEKIAITVESGMSSEQVANMLQTKSVVQSATDFDNYLKENGYSKTIAVGSYEINANSTYKEIAEIITNTN